ncbi:MAG: ComF family protein [Acidobacteria bacterium]|nr:ComF family protein [Acidobacteriota bacterium]
MDPARLFQLRRARLQPRLPRVLQSRAAVGKRGALRVCRYGVDAVLSVTLAPRCAACGCVLEAPLAGPVCGGCWSQVRMLAGPFCRTCGDPLPSWRVISVALEQCPRCRRRLSLVDGARAAGEYEGALREILHAFKYEGRRVLVGPLAAMMRAAGAGILGDADATIPVPLHPWRRMRRGFNQADALARGLGLPVLRALWRVRVTASQTGLHAAARRRNVRHAFGLSPFLSRERRLRLLEGRIVVLVDDVRTTGATLEACAAVLKDAGAREVRALTVARAAPPIGRV